MSHKLRKTPQASHPVITAYPSVPVIELSATQSITPSYSASMTSSYSQYRTFEYLVKPSSILTNEQWIGVFSAIFMIVACSITYNIRKSGAEKLRREKDNSNRFRLPLYIVRY